MPPIVYADAGQIAGVPQVVIVCVVKKVVVPRLPGRAEHVPFEIVTMLVLVTPWPLVAVSVVGRALVLTLFSPDAVDPLSELPAMTEVA